MLKKTRLLGWGLLLCSLSVSAQELGLPASAHLVTSGHAAISAPADMATISFAISLLDKDPRVARQQVDARVAAFVNALETAGFKGQDVIAGNLQLNPELEYNNNGSSRQLGYRALRQVSIRVMQLERVGQVIDVALKSGLNTVNQIEYGVRDAERFRQQARDKAFADSRGRAAEVAKAYGMTLGKVYSIQYLPAGSEPVFAAARAEGSSNAVFLPQEIRCEDNVSVVFLME